MTSLSVTARAFPNIALIKYWGKRNEDLIVPYGDSLSMTIDIFPTTTTVTLDPHQETDQIIFNGGDADHSTTKRISHLLALIRNKAGCDKRAIVDTTNDGPTGAGLASSASGMAALALAASRAYGLILDQRELSRLARRGSGSAARSIFGGFAIWYAGHLNDPDVSSYAEPLKDIPLTPALVIALVNDQKKNISSRKAMAHTVATSPLFSSWIQASREDLIAVRAGLMRGDLEAIGEIIEHNALGMHATMLAARPSVRYLSSTSLMLLDRVVQLRHEGLCAYATIDAGPNIKVLCFPEDADQISQALIETIPGLTTVVGHLGPGAHLLHDGIS